MLKDATVNKLQEMRLGTMARAFQEQLFNSDMESLSFEDKFGLLVDQKWTTRKNNHLKRLIKKASFAEAGALWKILSIIPTEHLIKLKWQDF